jgi:hypothetical protein
VGEVGEVVVGGRGAKKAAASWFKRLGSFRGPGPAVAAEKCGARDAMGEETYRGLVGLERVGPEEERGHNSDLHPPRVLLDEEDRQAQTGTSFAGRRSAGEPLER